MPFDIQTVTKIYTVYLHRTESKAITITDYNNVITTLIFNMVKSGALCMDGMADQWIVL